MNERLSLQDLIDLLAKKQELTKKDAETFLRELIAVISENIESNESVKIKEFGVFKLVKVNARKSVDVNTGVAIEIPAHYKLSFIPDKSLKEAVNRPFSHFESVILEEGVTFDNIESEERLSIVEDEDSVIEYESSEAEGVDRIATVIAESLGVIAEESPKLESQEGQLLDVTIDAEAGTDTDIQSVLQDVSDNIQSSEVKEFPDVKDVNSIHEEMVIDPIEEDLEPEIEENKQSEFIESDEVQGENVLATVSSSDSIDTEEGIDTDIQSVLEDVLSDNIQSSEVKEFPDIKDVNTVHEEMVIDPIEEISEPEIEEEKDVERVEEATIEIESVDLPVSPALEVVDIDEEELSFHAALGVQSQEQIESLNAEILSKIEDVNTVPAEIINRIEEEAASKNVSKDKILLVVREDSKDVKDKLATDDSKQKKIKRKYISLGVFVFLIIAGFVVGGVYFQKIASFLTTGKSNKESQQVAVAEKTSKSIAVIPDTTNLKKEQGQDSVLAKQDIVAPIAPIKEKEKKIQPEPQKVKAEIKKEEKPAPAPTNKVVNNSSSNIVTIQSGHTLRNIAMTHYGNKVFWIYIYMENKAVIKNPNSIPIGTKLVIPYPSKYGIDAKNKESVEKAKKLESKQIASMK